MERFGISKDKIGCVTVDNASNNDTFLSKLINNGVIRDKECHICCMAHVLNLVCQDMLALLSPSIKSLRTGIKAVRSSPLRLSQFQRFCEVDNCWLGCH